MNLPRYGWRRCTCFVRTRSGSSRSDHESSRSIPAYSASWVGATRASSTPRSKSLGQPLETAAPHRDHVEGRAQPSCFGVSREPRLGRAPHAPLLALVHHLQRIAELLTHLLLDLAEDERAAAPRDDVELVPTGPGVPGQNPVAAE